MFLFRATSSSSFITWRTVFEQQTDSTLSACGSHGIRIMRILIRSTWMNRVMHDTCIKHGRDIRIQCNLRKGLKFYQTRSNAIILQETLPAYCIPKVVRMENWRSHFRESIHVTSAFTTDLFGTWLEKRIGFRRCSTTRRTSCATIQKFPIEPTNSKP